MKPEFITDHIDIWTSAVKAKSAVGRGSSKKIDLYGIKKLRELILELAVRGKLVPQDPNDEPASVLLERIAVEKERLIEDGKAKKQKKLLKIIQEDEHFNIPYGWSWARLGDVGETNVGLTYSPKEVADEGIPVLRSANIQKGKIDLSDLVRVKKKVSDSVLVKTGDLLICARNGSKALVGKTAQIHKLKEQMVFGAFMTIFRSEINNYIEVFLNSPVYRKYLDGISTTTINQITQSNLRSTLSPIPPLQEQHRIVAKVDELMALCDKLEQQTQDSIDAHQLLVETLLTTLTNNQKGADFAQNWARLHTHFDILFTTERSIDALKQTILQLAVMGKLVPQDPNDEPASKLLERIAKEKAQLIKDKKIKKQKELPPITEEEKPFDLPKGWEWCRFGSVFYDLKYGTSQKSDYGVDGTPVLRIPNVVNGYVSTEDLKYSALSEVEIEDLKLSAGDLIFIRSNGSLGIVGRCIQVTKNLDRYAYAGYLVRARLPTDIVRASYIELAMKSIFIRNQIEKPIRTTTGVKNINSTELGNLTLALPSPLQQKKIVKKARELLAFCDEIKSHLIASQQTQLLLTDAIVEQTL